MARRQKKLSLAEEAKYFRNQAAHLAIAGDLDGAARALKLARDALATAKRRKAPRAATAKRRKAKRAGKGR